jgi:two-component sensor histidine kinase
LIINEVVTNSLKYAFNVKREGEIRITLLKTKAHLYLSILDDGDGMPKDFNIGDKSSFGYCLITSLSKKLDATITIHNTNGTSVNLAISKFIGT